MWARGLRWVVLAYTKAIIPAAVGVDIGCGMMAVETTLRAVDLPDNLKGIRTAIEAAVPHGRTSGVPMMWGRGGAPETHIDLWRNDLGTGFERLVEASTLPEAIICITYFGPGNHFIELCLDESDRVWVMLHSGSRGVGARIGLYFIELAGRCDAISSIYQMLIWRT